MTTFIRDGRSPSLHIMWAGRVLLLISVMVIFSAEGRKTNHVRCLERERQALLNFKRGLKDYYNTLSSWTSNEEECCTWRGIKCDNQTNHVVELDFYLQESYKDDDSYFDEYDDPPQTWSKFSGEIGTSLTEIIYMKRMDFSWNGFTKIPNFIGAFTKLRYLSFVHNPISGKIPSQLGNLTSLGYLDLGSDEQMTADDLDWLSHLPSLTTLYLQNLNLTKPVNWLQSVKEAPSLSSLGLWDCEFPYKVDISSLSHINSSDSLRALEIGDTTMHFTALPWLLNVSSNLINLTLWEDEETVPLPDYFGNIKSLQNIVLAIETNCGIPKSMGNLCKLRSLVLAYSCNFFNGTLEDILESLSGCATKSLEILSLDIEVGGPMPDLARFSSLRELHLTDNKINGSLSKSIGQLSNLEVLDVSSNYLTGAISEGHLQNLSKLQYLDLSSNSFTGLVSDAHLKKLSKLRYLDLSSNSFTLHFDSKWIPPFQLVEMRLRSCKLDDASFPTWLQTQLKMSVLDISYTGINTDAIPDWFYNMTHKLRYLDLSFNSIKGTLPNFSLRFDNYPTVDLSSNQFHGPIPLSLANATVLNLSNNTFTIFKPFLCAPIDRSTTFLDLSFNMLSGSLPNCWMHWQNLQYLNLGSNKLSGNIPSPLGLLHQVQALILRHNNFSGNLPSSLKNCTLMEVLDIGKNNLIGGVPKWIGERLSNLALLSLESNRFQGRLPSSLCYLDLLQILDLSLNDISGTIPSCFHNFTSMATKPDEYTTGLFSLYISDPPGGYGREYENTAYFMWKGQEYKYDKILGLLRLIDLSSNRLTGHIPTQLTDLVELKQLNLSRNNLSGSIPDGIRQFKLDSLDLSHNQLSGKIPMGLAYISSLAYLDLSYNHLEGKIPTSTQLQSFEASTYLGNTELCGPPLQTKCPENETLTGGDEIHVSDGAEWLDMSWFYMGLGVGFSIAFLGVSGWTLFFNIYSRPGYFHHLLYKLACH